MQRFIISVALCTETRLECVFFIKDYGN